MSRYIFDCETNGFLDELDRVHSLVLKDVESGFTISCTDHPYGSGDPTIITSDLNETWGIEDGLRALAGADEIIGHNVIKFDIPALQKVYPWFNPKGRVTDTIVLSRLVWPDPKPKDAALIRKGKLPGNLRGKHTLEAWGFRLGTLKSVYSGGFDEWSEEMQRYCEQDVEATFALWKRVQEKNYSQQAIDLEHEVAWLMAQQERNGFPFDEEAAALLYAELCGKRDEMERTLRSTFAPWWVNQGEIVAPKTLNFKDPTRPSLTAGASYTKVAQVQFNPASRQHIANRLTTLYGWEPEEFTDNGQPQIDETVLEKLPYPEAKLLAEYFLLEKRIGQLSEGNQGWLKAVRNGRIHGGVNPNGAVTGRATHMFPNIAQVPKVGSRYGKECRALFHAGAAGWGLVGADASGLELRCLGHFMAKWDDGAYAQAVVEGKSDQGTDVHSLNAKAIGLDPKGIYIVNGKQATGRDIAKRMIYAYLYGAGDEKLLSITGMTGIKAKLAKGIAALRELKKAVSAKCKKGWIKGLDGRQLTIRSDHAALNTLLQSAGALICKKWIVLLNQALLATGFRHGWDGDYAFCAWVHDEVQIACRNQEIANEVGRIAVECVREAGRFFAFRCPIDGEFKTGRTWADTH